MRKYIIVMDNGIFDRTVTNCEKGIGHWNTLMLQWNFIMGS